MLAGSCIRVYHKSSKVFNSESRPLKIRNELVRSLNAGDEPNGENIKSVLTLSSKYSWNKNICTVVF